MRDMIEGEPFFDFDNSFTRLPPVFYRDCLPSPVAAPSLIAFNRELACDLRMQIDGCDEAELAALFAGSHIPKGAQPLAMAYAGHQFGHFVPQLGDGRALLLGEVVDRAGARRDVQLKGSGRTPFSRSGDGRAALGPVMREYIVSEAMHALGIRTTRALAAVTTGEAVYRERPLPGAVLTRVALSHIRIGTFEFYAARNDLPALRQLSDYTLARLYPQAAGASQPCLALLEQVLEAQASLVASWMHVGFIHGVMNTDNMALSGETIDYGPCAFMDRYDPLQVFSAIDRQGRYAFANQPPIALWNLSRLAEALLPLIDPDPGHAARLAQERLEIFPSRFKHHWLIGMRKKLGLQNGEAEDASLAGDLLERMHQGGSDYTLTFRRLCAAAQDPADDQGLEAPLKPWLARWHARLGRQVLSPADCAASMRAVNPAYIPRNHRIEQAIEDAVERQDFTSMRQLMEVLARPYEERAACASYVLPPTAREFVYQTFCGT